MTTHHAFFLRALTAIIVFFFFVSSGYPSSSDKLVNEYSIEQLTANDGFVSSEIYSIIQDTQGFLWFGTAENGVMRYDGKKVKLFESNNDVAKGLSHNDAGNLMLDRDGNIWIGTWGGGVNKYNPATGIFQRFSHDPSSANSLSSNRIQSLFHDSAGAIWLGTYNKGLNKYLGDSKFLRVLKDEEEDTGLSHNRVWDIIESDEESLWVATSYGLNLLNKTTLTATHYFPDESNKTATGANEIRSLLLTRSGHFYVATQEGPFLFLPHSETFIPQLTQEGKSLGQVNSMIEDHQGDVWFVSTNGLYRHTGSDNTVEKMDFGYDNGLRIIFEDKTHTKWITSEVHGIFKLSPRRNVKLINSESLVAPNGIELDENGDVLIVNANAEIFKWQVKEQRLEQLSKSVFTSFEGYTQNGVLERPIIIPVEDSIIPVEDSIIPVEDSFTPVEDSITPAKDSVSGVIGTSTLWVAQDDYLAKLNRNTGEIDRIEYPKDDSEYRHFREFRALEVDDEGNLWVGTYKNGIYIYNVRDKTFKHLTQDDGLPHPEIHTIFKARSGNMWVGTGQGVSRWQKGDKSFMAFSAVKQDETLLGSIVEDIHQSTNGDIWIATQSGLNRYLPDTNSFKQFNEQEGLPATVIRSMSDGEEGKLWLTTNKGIFLYDPDEKIATNYTSSNALAGKNYYANSLVKSAQGTLFTSSQRGIEYFSDEREQNVLPDANIVLTEFNIMGEKASTDTALSYITDVHLSYEDYFFSFEFALLEYSSSTKSHFAYKLDGYDEQWIEIGSYNNVSFTHLKGGDYTLRVKALMPNGQWSKRQLALNLHVEKEPWKTWWAYTLYCMLLIGLVFLVIYLRTRLHQTEIIKQKSFVQALEQQVSEKTASLEGQAHQLKSALKDAEEATKLKSEFLANMSHEIRTPINGVIGMLGLLKNSGLNRQQAHRVDIANSSANSLLVLINDILDFSKIEADKLEIESVDFDLRDLIEELAYSIAHTAQEKGLEVVVDLAKVPISKINSDPNRIKQILNNLLSNAVKFTELGELSIEAELLPAEDEGSLIMRCAISDTGIGIEKPKLDRLFDAFTQVDASTTRRYGGTGLGLTITKKLCELLGGAIHVTSELGEGSCFIVTCKVNKVSDAQPIAPHIDTSNLRCLIVDKSRAYSAAIEKQFTLWGVNTTVAGSAKEALAQCEESFDCSEPITTLFIDKDVPDMPFNTFYNALRDDERFCDIRVVTMTSLKDIDSAEMSNALGVFASFPKPLSTNDFKSVLESNALSENSLSTGRENTLAHIASASIAENETLNNDEITTPTLSNNTQVLLVEDNAINQIVATSVMESAGFHVDVVSNGKEALELLQKCGDERVYSLVVMDCQMPEMDGFEATRQIRRGVGGKQYREVPIIAMTANAMKSDKDMCLQAGMNDFLTKPIEHNIVISTMKKWIDKSN
ncbi:hybrid sensor histidine kinase/response regulator [Alteromonas sp. BMJM2]|uniref:hybrid sensor histidine kinase/response regulator n=1 Tax=Alteromonas sp. BMJM2 TaxID=2954241 RepID=UPI0022B4F030|nr:hybrid sensor histidine kinase/response regulator [Alteromonas sp. BMJM2]